jgi:hypothetical protein
MEAASQRTLPKNMRIGFFMPCYVGKMPQANKMLDD